MGHPSFVCFVYFVVTPTSTVSPPPALPQPSWFTRHWRWFVPVLAMAAGLFFYGFFSLVSSVMKNSEVHQLALARVQASPAVAAALGTPITEGFLVKGNIHVSGPSGQAQLEIPIQGPKDSATIYVAAEKSKGEWHFEYLVVQPAHSKTRLDLLETKPAPGRQ